VTAFAVRLTYNDWQTGSLSKRVTWHWGPPLLASSRPRLPFVKYVFIIDMNRWHIL
jgi:hypothetical protein